MTEKDGDELLLETDDSLFVDLEVTVERDPLVEDVDTGVVETEVKEVVDLMGKPSDEKQTQVG